MKQIREYHPRLLTREHLMPLMERRCKHGLSALDRFHSRYATGSPDDCWLWTGGVNKDGYGQLSISDFGSLGPHQIAHLIHFGSIPPGTVVMHTCDVPGCVNPHHLRLGTRHLNSQDMLVKNRVCRNGNRPVLTPSIVRNARARYAAGEALDSISRTIAANRKTVRDAILRNNWKHVSDEVSA